MKESEKEELQNSINLFGGTIRYFIAIVYTFLFKKEKPKRTNFTVPPDKEIDYFGNSKTNF